MQCRNHAKVEASGSCTGCNEPFCSKCLVPIVGKPYCAGCKMSMVPGSSPPPPPTSRVLAEAKKALLLAVVGMFCAYVLEPIALAKAAEAQRLLDADPTLDGRGMVVAARVIAILELLVWVLLTLAVALSLGRGPA